MVSESHGASTARKRGKTVDGFKKVVRQELDTPEHEEVVEFQSRHPYPIVAPHPVYIIYTGIKQFSYDQRMNVLNKHVDTHFRNPEYQSWFPCRYPNCSKMLDGKTHFKRHALDVHRVSH
jgi:hypothetical protein